MKRAVLLVLFGIGSSCGPPPVVMDAGTDAGNADAGLSTDAGFDAGEPDAGFDAGEPDAGEPDAGAPDAGIDAGFDAGVDAGFDAGVDAGFDAGTPIDAGSGLCPQPSGVGPVFRLRAMAANLTSGNNQSYSPGDGIRIMQGADPDIVMIQEFNYGGSSPAEIATMVATTFDGGFAYHRGVGNIPNGVISRWPIVAQGEWNGGSPDRELTWAQVDLPGPNDLWVISVHLPTSSASARNMDAQTLVQQMDAGIPPGDYLLLGGDLNTDNRSEVCFSTFSARLVTAAPFPVDQYGDDDTSGNRSKPYDHVLASPCLARLQGPTTVGTSTFDAGLVIDTRGYFPMSDLAPALATDSAATNMQHMGVIKDFFIQP